MVTTTTNCEMQKPVCFSTFYAPQTSDCRCCMFSQDCMQAWQAKKQQPVTEVKTTEQPLPAASQFRGGSQGQFLIDLLKTGSFTREEIAAKTIEQFGGKGTGALAALSKLVAERAVNVTVEGRVHRYTLVKA